MYTGTFFNLKWRLLGWVRKFQHKFLFWIYKPPKIARGKIIALWHYLICIAENSITTIKEDSSVSHWLLFDECKAIYWNAISICNHITMGIFLSWLWIEKSIHFLSMSHFLGSFLSFARLCIAVELVFQSFYKKTYMYWEKKWLLNRNILATLK